VQALYLDELGRVGTRAELDRWTPALDSTGGSQSVINGIKGSQEARAHLVKSWYLTYLGRAVGTTNNASEEQGFVNELLAGVTEEQVLSQILGTAEFASHAQTLDSSGTPQDRVVTALCHLLLNRSPGPGLGEQIGPGFD
jgi:hypothetical protein